MMGVAFGNKDGLIPAIELEVLFKKFNFYSETEYVFDFAGKENNFLYTWGEIAYSPIEVLNVGISFQRGQVRAATVFSVSCSHYE